MDGRRCCTGGEKVIHRIRTIWLVFSSAAGRGSRGGQQMQQHARERQDGQTTLGPQSSGETISVSPEARHWQSPVTRLRRPLHRWNPDQRGNATLSTQHIPLSADAKREQGFHARNPKHLGPRAFTARPVPGKRNEKEREDGPKCSRKPSIQRWVGLYLDGTVSPSVSPANDNTLEMFWILVTCTHIIYAAAIGQMLGEPKDKALIVFPLSSDIRTTQAARDTL